MQETAGLLDKIRHHDKVPIAVNKNCTIPLPQDVLLKLFNPHKLSFYYFAFMDRGTASFVSDSQEITISDGQMIIGLPNQIFTNLPFDQGDEHYTISFDENTLALLPNSYAFLLNPFNQSTITFDLRARKRVRIIFSLLFELLHFHDKQRNAEIILANLNTLLIEFNNAYFEHAHADTVTNNLRLSKYIAFKLAVETHLTEQHDVQTIAKRLAMTTSSLYGVVKGFSGVSPKEFIINRLMVEAQRRLQSPHLLRKSLPMNLASMIRTIFRDCLKRLPVKA